jgi:transposase InsO family protein
LSKISTGLTLDQDPTDICIPCTKGKSHERSFPKSNTHETQIGFKIHCDLIEFEVRSILGNYKWAVIFIDDCSRFAFAYPLERKSDTSAAIKNLDQRIHNYTGRHIAILRSDNDTVIFNKEMTAYCIQHGIFQEASTPYNPAETSRVKRSNRVWGNLYLRVYLIANYQNHTGRLL